jgi:hypothetical protein
MQTRKSVEDLEQLVGPTRPEYERIDGIVVGRLIGLRESHIPLVVYPGQPAVAAVPARTVVDMRGEHIGREVVLSFERGDPSCPIVMGCLKPDRSWPLPARPEQVEVDVDGERLIISSTQEIVLRCGKSSITLTRQGRVDIRGTYVVTHSKGVNRIKGGSVQIN